MSEELTAIDPAELEADLAEVMAAAGESRHKEMVAKFARIANQALLDRDASRAREKALVEALRPFAREGLRFIDNELFSNVTDASKVMVTDLSVGDLRCAARVLAPYSTPSPDMPSDCHPQGE